MGFAVNLARPGGNMTGVVIDAGIEIWEKRFELLREVVPTAATVAFAVARQSWDHPYGRAAQHAAQKTGIVLTLFEIPVPAQEAEYRRTFATLRERGIGALAMNDGPGALVYRQLIVQLVEEARVPTVYPFREFVNVGGLMAYAVELRSLHVHAARQVDQILKGAKPGEIPFYQPTKFEVAINLKAAKTLGLTVPPSVLARADEVIE
jgi:putative ABC transport system substrate-binding protein